MAYRLGIDTGGTFTDLAVVDESGVLRMYKSPTTPRDYTEGIINCLKLCALDYQTELNHFLSNVDDFVIHGSTVATNTVIEGKGAKVGMICTRGFRDMLYRGEGNKQDVFNWYIPYRRALVPTYLCLEVDERVNSEGEIVVALEENTVRSAIQQLKEWNVDAIGVCLLWSIVNSKHEKRVEEIIRKEWLDIPVSLSSEIQPIIREYRRASCVAFDAMLKPVIRAYTKNLQEALAEHGFAGELLMVVSSGGIMNISEAVTKPVYTLFSGPAMGPIAGLFYAKQESTKNIITIDMGGTSFDVSTVVDGIPSVTRDARVGDYPTGVTSVEVITLGAGGGSIGWVDQGGLLRVGPKSAGAEPGPACYGTGGTEPTVTDANVVLGYINPEYLLAGRMKIYPELSRNAIKEKIAEPLNQDLEKAASGIYRVVNEKMVGGILDMTVRRGIDPREFLLVVGGGAGSLHVARIAKELGIRRIIIPKTAPVLCAMGMLNADVTFSYAGSKYTDTKDFDINGVNSFLAELESRAITALDRAGILPEKRKLEYYVAARYNMQINELDIPLRESRLTPESIPQLSADFHAVHAKRYAISDPTSHIECTDWRVVGVGCLPKTMLRELPYAGEDASQAMKKLRNTFFEEVGGFMTIPVYDGGKLGYGMKIHGPAIIEDPLNTTVVIPNSKVTVDRVGSYDLEIC